MVPRVILVLYDFAFYSTIENTAATIEVFSFEKCLNYYINNIIPRLE